ncbi:MAG: YtxH domain-containing protein [Chloroflexi bacterium]|nr:YtxH domain-containing protein [Chloroflexota bacterium]
MAEEREGSGVQAFVFGFVAGAVVGGLLGVLFAPQSGEETRSQVREQALRLKERVRSLGETGQEAMRDAISQGREAAGRARQEMEEWVQRTRRPGGEAPS